MLTNILLFSILGLIISLILSATWKILLIFFSIFILLLLIKIYFSEKNVIKLKTLPKLDNPPFPKQIIIDIIFKIQEILQQLLEKVSEPKFTILQKASNYDSCIIQYLIAKFNVVEVLEKYGPMTCEQLCERLPQKINSKLFSKVMRSAALKEKLLYLNKDFQFFPTKYGKLLSSNNSNNLKGAVIFETECNYYAYYHIYNSLLKNNDKNIFENQFQCTPWEYLEQRPQLEEELDNYMAALTKLDIESILHVYDFSKAQKICDLAGGNGLFLKFILESYPNIKGFVLERERVVQRANKLFQQNNIFERAKGVEFDLFEQYPKQITDECDLYILRNTLLNWADENVVQILQNFHKNTSSQSKLLIIEQINDIQNQPQIFNELKTTLDFRMTMLFNARQRSLQEYDIIFAQSNLKRSKLFNLRLSSWSIIEVIKKQ